MPRDWADYLKNSENKKELFAFLANGFLENLHGFGIVTNILKEIKSSGGANTNLITDHCTAMEEAHARILTHVWDMARQGAKSVRIRATDTDVVVIAISYFYALKDLGLVVIFLDGLSGNLIFLASG